MVLFLIVVWQFLVSTDNALTLFYLFILPRGNVHCLHQAEMTFFAVSSVCLQLYVLNPSPDVLFKQAHYWLVLSQGQTESGIRIMLEETLNICGIELAQGIGRT